MYLWISGSDTHSQTQNNTDFVCIYPATGFHAYTSQYVCYCCSISKFYALFQCSYYKKCDLQSLKNIICVIAQDDLCHA